MTNFTTINIKTNCRNLIWFASWTGYLVGWLGTGPACWETAGSTSKKCSSNFLKWKPDLWFLRLTHPRSLTSFDHSICCRYVPILGWAWGLSDTIFLERNWEKDQVRFSQCSIFLKFWIVGHLEERVGKDPGLPWSSVGSPLPRRDEVHEGEVSGGKRVLRVARSSCAQPLLGPAE